MTILPPVTSELHSVQQAWQALEYSESLLPCSMYYVSIKKKKAVDEAEYTGTHTPGFHECRHLM